MKVPLQYSSLASLVTRCDGSCKGVATLSKELDIGLEEMGMSMPPWAHTAPVSQVVDEPTSKDVTNSQLRLRSRAHITTAACGHSCDRLRFATPTA